MVPKNCPTSARNTVRHESERCPAEIGTLSDRNWNQCPTAVGIRREFLEQEGNRGNRDFPFRSPFSLFPPVQKKSRAASPSQGAILWTMTTRPGTCRGGLSRRRLCEGGSVRVLAFHLRQGYGGQVGLACLPRGNRMIRLRLAFPPSPGLRRRTWTGCGETFGPRCGPTSAPGDSGRTIGAIVFPSESAAMKALDTDMLMAR